MCDTSKKDMAEMGYDSKGSGDMGNCLQYKEKLQKAMRYIAYFAIVCGLMFVLTLIACAISLYFYTQLNEIRQELNTLVKFHKMDGGIEGVVQSQQQKQQQLLADSLHKEAMVSAEPIDRYERKAILENKARNEKKNKRRRRKECKCKKLSSKQKLVIEKMIDEKLESLKEKQQSAQETAIQETEQFSFVSASHYTTFVDNDYISKRLGAIDSGDLENTVMYVEEEKWQGKLFRNRTFIHTGAPLTMKFFKEADWMKTLTTDKLFDYNSDTGKFEVRHSGLYHLYAHVLFYDLKTRMAIGIRHESESNATLGREEHSSTVFRCMESTDYVDSVGHNSKFKSCNVNGVLYLRSGDKVSLQSLYRNTCIDLTSDATYFGAVLFSSNELLKRT